MHRSLHDFCRCASAAALAAALTLPAPAQVANLRVSELDPATGQVEILNTGGAFSTTGFHPFCHRFNYATSIPSATAFAAGGRLVFSLSGLDSGDSDVWLYRDGAFGSGGSLIHGMKYGPQGSIGRTPLAASVGLWNGPNAFTPLAPSGMTIAWDGFGNESFDWYVDQTPTIGLADSTPAGTVASTLAYPAGTQDFENVPLGDEVNAIIGWPIVNTSAAGRFTVRAVGDVRGVTAPRPGSSSNRWLRVRDQDATNVQNRFYSSSISAPAPEGYTWTFFVNLETTPPAPAAATRPRIMIQHVDGAGFANVWGIEFNSTGANLIVVGNGGPAGSTPLYTLASPTGLGDWVRLTIKLDLGASTVSATVNGGTPVSLPVAPAVSVNLTEHRFCFRGEGTDSISTLLIDDISFAAAPVVVPCPLDLSGNGIVDADDIFAFLNIWFAGPPGGTCTGCQADWNNDGSITADDIFAFLNQWFAFGPGALCP